MDKKTSAYRVKKAVYSALSGLTYKGNAINVYGFFRYPDNVDVITYNFEGIDISFKAYVLLTNTTETEDNASDIYASDVTLTVDVTCVMPQSIASELPSSEIGEEIVRILKANTLSIDEFYSLHVLVENINSLVDDDENTFIARNIIDFRFITQQK